MTKQQQYKQEWQKLRRWLNNAIRKSPAADYDANIYQVVLQIMDDIKAKRTLYSPYG